MKTSTENATHALTLIEILVVIAVLAILAVLLIPPENDKDPALAWRITCISNLKRVGAAFLESALKNGDKYPMRVSVTNGGAMELVAKGNVASVFRIMSNELNTPRILVCPADTKRTAATNFDAALNNTKISYFVGLDALNSVPGMFLSGDRNITNGTPLRHGILELTTNQNVGWTKELHDHAGNAALADGSVMQLSMAGLNDAHQKSGAASNRLAIP